MNRPYNILFFSEETGLTGAGVVLVRIMKNIDRRYFNPIVFTNQYNTALIEILEKEKINYWKSYAFRDLKSMYYFETGIGVRKLISRMTLIYRITFELVSCIRKHGIDLIHANNYPVSLYCVFPSFLSRIPFVFHEHNLRPIRPHNWLNYRMVGIACAKTVTVSVACKNNLIAAIPPKKIMTIRNGIELTEYDASRSEQIRNQFKVGRNDHLLAIIGQPREEKGSHVFIEAAARVVKKFPDAKFLVVGYLFKDAYQQKLYKLTRDLGLENNVVFTGWRNDIPDVISSVDLLVHCRLTPEPAALVLIEAMAASKPVVVSDTGGSREIVLHDITGKIYPPCDSKALSRAIIDLLQNPSLLAKMGRAGRNRVEQKFTIQRQAQQFESLYLDVLKSI